MVSAPPQKKRKRPRGGHFTIVRFCLYYIFFMHGWKIAYGQEQIDIFQPDNATSTPSLRPSSVSIPDSTTTSTQPSTSPSNSLSPSETPTISLSLTISEAPSISSQPSTSPKPSATPSGSPTIAPTQSAAPSSQPSSSPTLTFQPSHRPSAVPSRSAAPSSIPSAPPSLSVAPSLAPSLSMMPSLSMAPSEVPSQVPSTAPTLSPAPSQSPSVSNAPSRSAAPSDMPSDMPSEFPSSFPTVSPYPSATPTNAPTGVPSATPSDAPSGAPSQAPSYNPTIAYSQDIGMTIHGLVYDNGLVEETGIDEGTVAQWENITSRHVMSYWNSVDKAGIEVYGVNTTLIVAKREANQRTMVPKERLLQVTDDLLPPNVTIPIDSSSPNITPGPTISPSLQGNWSGNETAFPVNISSAPNGMPSFSPTANPTTSYQPSISAAPTQPPSWSVMPSSQPTTTVAPSAQPTQLPEPLPLVIWYSQTVVYGVVFNDTRRPTDDEIFQWPFLFDQKQYTQAIQHMTQNQLTIYIDPVFVDVRFNSEMPSTMPSTFPSSQPSEMPTSAPTVITSPPSRGSDTSTIIVAVVVPVTVVLLIAFAGICYVTREAVQRNDSDESVEDVIPIPAQHDPGWSPPPGGTLPGSVMSGQAPEEIHPLHRHSGGSASHGHPEVVSRHPSHTSAISELSAVDTERRRFQGTPGFMSPTGTFTPSLAPLAPGSAHSRDSSLQSEPTGLSRVATTGGIATRRVSPFQGARGSIPTIPTAQLQTPDLSNRGGGGEENPSEGSSVDGESDESDSDDSQPNLSAFNLQIEDLDDF